MYKKEFAVSVIHLVYGVSRLICTALCVIRDTYTRRSAAGGLMKAKVPPQTTDLVYVRLPSMFVTVVTVLFPVSVYCIKGRALVIQRVVCY